MIKRTPLFETHYNKLYLNYRRPYREYWNDHFREQWHIEEIFFAFAGFEKSWFELNNLRYDAHEVKSIVVCGITIGWGYSYQCEPMSKMVGV